MRDKLIVAHRGASAYAKDNSIDSFTKAIEMGADMIESDVRQTADGVLIAHHDPTTGGRLISETTYDELKSIDGDIATYEEVLKLTQGKIKLDIELKEQGYEKEAVDLALEFFSPDDFVVTSFNVKALAAVKTCRPEIKTGLILGRNQPKNMVLVRLFGSLPVKWAKRLHAHYLVLDHKLANVGLLKLAKQSGLKVLVWTVNYRGDMKRFLQSNMVCGIITNHPDIAVEMNNQHQ